MSRTPEIIRNKRAEKTQINLYAFGFVFGLASWGAFSSDEPGLGLILAGITIVLIYSGSKIKTTYQKYAEKGMYR